MCQSISCTCRVGKNYYEEESEVNDQQLIKNVNEVAENKRQQRGYIAPVDVLMEIGVLTEQNYEAWRYGKVSYLEKALDFFHSVLISC